MMDAVEVFRLETCSFPVLVTVSRCDSKVLSCRNAGRSLGDALRNVPSVQIRADAWAPVPGCLEAS